MIIVCVILVVYVISLCIPLVWGFITSLKGRREFTRNDNYLGFPTWKYSAEEIKFKNYIDILKNFEIETKVSYLANGREVNIAKKIGIFEIIIYTLLYCVGGAFIYAIVPFTVAYLVQKFKYKFSKFVYVVALASMVIPSVGTMAAEITMLRNMGLYNSIWGNYIQKFNFGGQYFFVYCAFFAGFSDGYSEAATIDGASQFKIFTHIVVPLGSKILLTVFMLQLVGLWNDYQTPLLYLPTYPTLAYAVYKMTFGTWSASNSISSRIAGCMILAIPMLVFFIAFKEKIMGNVTMGGLKE